MARGQPDGGKKPPQKKKHSIKHTTEKPSSASGFTYDKEARCWRGPVARKQDTSEIIKKLRIQEEQKKKQIPDALQHDRKKALKTADPDVAGDEDTWSVGLGTGPDSSKIKKPFVDVTQIETCGATWCVPETKLPEKITWEKPVNTGATKAAINSPAQMVIQLKQDLDKKDKDMDVLRKQLLKSHAENMKLVNELKACSGPKYGDVLQENAKLKDQSDRLTRQITKLWGDRRKDDNHLLHKIEREEALEIKEMQELTAGNRSHPQK